MADIRTVSDFNELSHEFFEQKMMLDCFKCDAPFDVQSMVGLFDHAAKLSATHICKMSENGRNAAMVFFVRVSAVYGTPLALSRGHAKVPVDVILEANIHEGGVVRVR